MLSELSREIVDCSWGRTGRGACPSQLDNEPASCELVGVKPWVPRTVGLREIHVEPGCGSYSLARRPGGLLGWAAQRGNPR